MKRSAGAIGWAGFRRDGEERGEGNGRDAGEGGSGAERTQVPTNNLEAYWMPFTANRQFKKAPRMLVAAEGMYYRSADGRKILDGTAGLWCCNAGHAPPEDRRGDRQAGEGTRLRAALPDGPPEDPSSWPPVSSPTCRPASTTSSSPTPARSRSRPRSRSRSPTSAPSGQGTRFRLIGRERGYHGVNFGGISVGGMVNNRKQFGTLLTGVDHIRHTHDIARNAFTRGQPAHGAELADDLERLVALHDASTIAAVIVEPVAGSAGVLIPPKGYLEKLRAICDKHGILLIFDEVITGYGRLGAPFAVDYFGVTPDLVVTAKGLTNGVIPMGAVFVKKEIYDAFMTGPEHMIELFHGYTYSGNPVASAAALGTLDTYEEEGLLTRGAELADYWADALHSLKGLPARHRHPQHRPRRRGRAGADRRLADQARLHRLPRRRSRRASSCAPPATSSPCRRR